MTALGTASQPGPQKYCEVGWCGRGVLDALTVLVVSVVTGTQVAAAGVEPLARVGVVLVLGYSAGRRAE